MSTKFAILGDTHFGASNSSIIHHAYMEKFFDDFFDYLEDHNIKEILQLGDLFDVRKFINTWSLNFFKRVFHSRVVSNKLHVYVLLGNHDIFYKESLQISSVEEVLSDYPEYYTIIKKPTDITIGKTQILAIPWVCKENANDVAYAIENTDSRYCVGHFEFNGFELFRGQLAKTEYSHTEYKKFKRVISGHYHHMSVKDNVMYTGTPYELTWQDCNTTKGFFVFSGGKISLVENQHTLYSSFRLSDVSEITGDLITDKYVKILVDVPLTPKERDAIIDKVYSLKPHDVSLIEQRTITEAVETTYTQTTTVSDLISDYITNINVNENIDKTKLSSIMMSLYVEASANAS